MEHELQIFSINEELSKQILNTSNLPERKMCNKLSKVYCEGLDCEIIFTISEKSPVPENERGAFGTIYQACTSDSCDYVAKYQHGINLDEAQMQHKANFYGLAPKVHQVLMCDSDENPHTIIIMDALKQTAISIIKQVSDEQLNYAKSRFTKQLTDKNIDPTFYESVKPTTIDDLIDIVGLIKRQKGIKIEFDILEDSEDQQIIKMNLIKDIVNILHSLHKINILHNDTHLYNFMIDKNNKVFAIDFGASIITNKGFELDFTYFIHDITTLIKLGYVNLRYLEEYYYKLRREEKN